MDKILRNNLAHINKIRMGPNRDSYNYMKPLSKLDAMNSRGFGSKNIMNPLPISQPVFWLTPDPGYQTLDAEIGGYPIA